MANMKIGSKIPTQPQQPVETKFTIKFPDGYQPVDLYEQPLLPHAPNTLGVLFSDIIKLTAQFVARNGRSFLAGLTTREMKNPQFEFLKPQHPLFTLFQQVGFCRFVS